MGNTGMNSRTGTGRGSFMRCRASEATLTVCGARPTTVAFTLLKKALAPAAAVAYSWPAPILRSEGYSQGMGKGSPTDRRHRHAATADITDMLRHLRCCCRQHVHGATALRKEAYRYFPVHWGCAPPSRSADQDRPCQRACLPYRGGALGRLQRPPL